MRRERVGTAVVVLAALALGSQLQQRLPAAGDVLKRDFEHPAAIGQSVTLRDRVVTATQVRASRSIGTDFETHRTLGHWVVVTVELESRANPVSLESTLVAADGRTFGGALPVSAPCGVAQVGLKRTCQALFELPDGALEGAHLRIPAGSGKGTDVAVVDLGIDHARATELEAATEPIKVVS